MTETFDDRLVKELQGDIPLEARPFAALGRKLGCSEDEVLEAVRRLNSEGRLKRIAAVLRHVEAGYRANAMVAWRVEKEEADAVGRSLAECPEVSHCYWRKTPEEWNYRLFTMVHARTREELFSVIDEISNRIGVNDFRVLETVKEYKKSSARYR